MVLRWEFTRVSKTSISSVQSADKTIAAASESASEVSEHTSDSTIPTCSRSFSDTLRERYQRISSKEDVLVSTCDIKVPTLICVSYVV